MKKFKILSLLLVFVLLVGCSDNSLNNTPVTDDIDITDTSEDLSSDEIQNLLDDEVITISGDSINLSKYYTGYAEDPYTVLADDTTITVGGTYVLEGNYDTTITINVGDDEDVDLILNNATVSVLEGPAILILNAEDVTISSLPDTVNIIEDTSDHTTDETGEDYNAAIYSTTDLIFNGTGSLTVNGNYNNAINSKDDIRIVETNLTVYSVDDGIIGKDYIAIKEATITVNSDGDALLSTNTEDTSKGFIYIESGTFTLDAGADCIQAATAILLYDGTFNLTAGDDGLASDGFITIGGGTFTIDSTGDAVNATTELTIYDGTFTINADDDALHSDDVLTIEGGDINIESSYEGIEAYAIIINGGTVYVTSTDDGINATTGGGQLHGTGYVSTGGSIEFNGGIVYVNSVSDGVDANGDITMTDGYLIVYATSETNQSPIDFDGSFTVSGGLVVAIGSTGMIQAIDSSSSQASLLYADTEEYSAGTEISLLDSDGNSIITLEAVRDFTGLIMSCEAMVDGASFTLQLDDTTYDFTITTTVTSLGDGGVTQGSMPGGTPGRR